MLELDAANYISLIAIVISLVAFIWNLRIPRLRLEYKDQLPFKRLTTFRGSPTVFLRVRVSNKGFFGGLGIQATDCCGKITDWYTDGQPRTETDYDPVTLHWVSKREEDFSSLDIALEDFTFLDIVRSSQNRNDIEIYTEEIKRGTESSFDASDNHCFKLTVHCGNGPPVSKWYKLQKINEKLRQEGLEPWLCMTEMSGSEIMALRKGASEVASEITV